MKIILSRKGFDSSAGGVPSPILPGGRLLSLPIPDPLSAIPYQRIEYQGENLGQLVEDLSGKKISSTAQAHLDPDLREKAIPRQPGWRPLFGQAGAAQGHLRKQNVASGDVFLFFGLFQPAVQHNGKLSFDRYTARQHIIWGWLQIGEIHQVETCNSEVMRWAAYHPHFKHADLANNTLYMAAQSLTVGSELKKIAKGAGVFTHLRPELTLTAPDASAPSQWQLPKWFYPDNGKPPLTYHTNPDRWRTSRTHTQLQAASRGQEFVLDTNYYPEAIGWLSELIE